MFSRKQFNSERERFRLFDLRSNLTNSFSIRSRKSIRLALIGGFIASFFFFPLLATEMHDFLFDARSINHPLEFSLREMETGKFFSRDESGRTSNIRSFVELFLFISPHAFEARTKEE